MHILSEAPGAYGSRSDTGHIASALAIRPDLEIGMAPWHIPGRHYPGVSLPLQSLVRPCVPTCRSAPGPGVVVNTDASKMGWGAICNEQAASGSRTGPRLQCHISYLELLAVLLALRQFLPMLRDKHMQVHTDNIATVAYINRQAIYFEQGKFYNTVQVLGELNCTALMTAHSPRIMATPPPGGPAHLQLIRRSSESSKCQLFYSLTESPLGRDALTHSWSSGS
ncbi:hypothetical protein M9458_055838 [Cirrhinus mrigala]|uniref:Reverse transcriptase RNase H-like domain-containing protein n=1 Tax=Cirrhinus mrigala TaxID=683832 RepID=A0ABD0MF04_CIRMR